ncbi:MAG: hypothetical protein IKK76_01505 [Alphaproteobacteria bacterium]|nr:hypothetical protein [Alphaproteobacteria bacterium]
MKVAVIGAGAWGTALAIIIAQGGADVTLWSYDGEYKHFDGVKMPSNLAIVSDMEHVKKADLWCVVTPAAFFAETMQKARNVYDGQPIIICTKGMDPKSKQFMSEILTTQIPECVEYGALSGPQFAGEVAAGVPTGTTIAGTTMARTMARDAFNKLFIEESDDIIGTQFCGVGKNAMALICGYNSVAIRGENERAMIFTRAWNEIIEIGLAAGAKLRTFSGLCGIGDLFLSATSGTSRNFSGGVAIAQGKEPEGTVEGIFALAGLVERAKDLGIDIPTLRQMHGKLNK